ncbi:hypothetical protein [Phenylobacterium sp.]
MHRTVAHAVLAPQDYVVSVLSGLMLGAFLSAAAMIAAQAI